MLSDPSPTRARFGPIARPGVAIALLLASLIPLIPAFFARHYPSTHESFRYEILTILFRDAIAHGHVYPRWLPDLAGGHGYPTFVFYQPLVFWVGSLVSLLPIDSSRWIHVVDYLFLVIGSSGAYRLARLFGDRADALLSAVLFMLTPYLFVNLHIRGDASELASMMVLVWPIWALVSLRQRFETGQRFFGVALGGAVSLAAVIIAHPATALVGVPVLGLLGLSQWFTLQAADRKQWLVTTFAIGVLALAIASPYWFCVWQCSPFVNLDRISQSYFQAQLHTVTISQLLSIQWSFGVSAGALGNVAEMSTPLGVVHAAMATAALFLGWNQRWIRVVGAIYVLLIVAMLPISAGFWSLSQNPLRAIQFPWRLLAVIAPLQVLLCAALLGRIRQNWIGGVLAFLAAGVGWQMYRVSPEPHRIDNQECFLTWKQADKQIRDEVALLGYTNQTFAGMDEFDPIWMQAVADPRGERPILSSLEPIEFLPDHSRYLIHARVTAKGESGVRIEQLYFPGWRVDVNGKQISDDELRAAVTSDGMMLIPIPAGTSELRAAYEGPPGAAYRLTSAAALAMVSLVLIKRIKRIPSRRDNFPATPDATPSLPTQETAPGP